MMPIARIEAVICERSHVPVTTFIKKVLNDASEFSLAAFEQLLQEMQPILQHTAAQLPPEDSIDAADLQALLPLYQSISEFQIVTVSKATTAALSRICRFLQNSLLYWMYTEQADVFDARLQKSFSKRQRVCIFVPEDVAASTGLSVSQTGVETRAALKKKTLTREDFFRLKITPVLLTALLKDVSLPAALQPVQQSLKLLRKIFLGLHYRLISFVYARTSIARLTSLEESFSAGALGLLRAAESYDARRERMFSTFAHRCIETHMLREYNLSQLLRFPAPAVLEQLRTPVLSTQRPIPFSALFSDRQYSEDFSASLDALLHSVSVSSGCPEEVLLRDSVSTQLHCALESLSTKEQLIIRRRFGIAPYNTVASFTEIGLELSLSRERIRQVEAIALQKLRRNLWKTFRVESLVSEGFVPEAVQFATEMLVCKNLGQEMLQLLVTTK